MFNSAPPSRADLPDAGRLVRSTLVAMAGAALILVLIVLPAEYAIDPTGVGRVLGLTEMGEIKMQLAAEAAAEAAASEAAADREPAAAWAPATPLDSGEGTAVAPGRSDEVRFSLTPGQGAEYKLVMRSGARARFSWSTDSGPINYDAHGSAPGQRVSYGTGRGVTADEGAIEAAFDGDHGWFFRNRTDAAVTVTLRTSGDYTELKKVL